jgi:DNA-binding NarL/FixJ family response regulator
VSRSVAPTSEVLRLLVEDHAINVAADLLDEPERTVPFPKCTIMEQLGVKTSALLVQCALEHGIVKKTRELTRATC